MNWLAREAKKQAARVAFYAATVSAGDASARSLRKCKPCADDLVELAEDIAEDAGEADEDTDYECEDAKPDAKYARSFIGRERAREARRVAFYAGEGGPCGKGQNPKRDGCTKKEKDGGGQGPRRAVGAPAVTIERSGDGGWKAPPRQGTDAQKDRARGRAEANREKQMASLAKDRERGHAERRAETQERVKAGREGGASTKVSLPSASEAVAKAGRAPRSAEARAATADKKTANAVKNETAMHSLWLDNAAPHEVGNELGRLSGILESGRMGGRKLSPRGKAVIQALHADTAKKFAEHTDAHLSKMKEAISKGDSPGPRLTAPADAARSQANVEADRARQAAAAQSQTIPSLPGEGGMDFEPEPDAPAPQAEVPQVAAPQTSTPDPTPTPQVAPAPTLGVGAELRDIGRGAVAGAKAKGKSFLNKLDDWLGGAGVGGRGVQMAGEPGGSRTQSLRGKQALTPVKSRFKGGR